MKNFHFDEKTPDFNILILIHAGTFPPPEIGKIVVEIWGYLPEVYTFGAESEIQEIFRNI